MSQHLARLHMFTALNAVALHGHLACLIRPLLLLLQEAIISHGCTVKSSEISRAVVGLRSHVEDGCVIDVSDCLGPSW